MDNANLKEIVDLVQSLAILAGSCFVLWLILKKGPSTCCEHCHTHEEDEKEKSNSTL